MRARPAEPVERDRALGRAQGDRVDGNAGVLRLLRAFEGLEDAGSLRAVGEHENRRHRALGVVVERRLLRGHVGACLRHGAAAGQLDRSRQRVADRSAAPRIEIVDGVANDLAVARERRHYLRLRGERDDADAVAVRQLLQEEAHGFLSGSQACRRHVLREHRARAVDGEDDVGTLPLRRHRHLRPGESEQRSCECQEEEDRRHPAAPCAPIVDHGRQHVEVGVPHGVLRAPALEHDVHADGDRNEQQQREHEWPLEAHGHSSASRADGDDLKLGRKRPRRAAHRCAGCHASSLAEDLGTNVGQLGDARLPCRAQGDGVRQRDQPLTARAGDRGTGCRLE